VVFYTGKGKRCSLFFFLPVWFPKTKSKPLGRAGYNKVTGIAQHKTKKDLDRNQNWPEGGGGLNEKNRKPRSPKRPWVQKTAQVERGINQSFESAKM